jgi:flagellar basal-body rod modification protein FlgD
MITTGIDTVTGSGTQSSSLPKKVMDKDAFLNLLVTQLQNQDPLNPTDSVEFTAQLAQFSSLEQLSNVNTNLEQLQNYQASINNSQAVSLIGKDITARGNGLQLDDGGPAECNFSLDGSAAVATISIYDSTGEFVKSFEGKDLAAGQNTLFWDGTDKDGNKVTDGVYTFEILAADAEGQNIKATTFYSGTVDKVTFENNQAYLISGTQKYALGDVIQVGVPETTKDADNQ